MKRVIFILIIVSTLPFTTRAGTYTETTMSDFATGTRYNVDIISSGDGGLRLHSLPVIRVLQVYPNGHSTTVVWDAIEAYMGSGNPPLVFSLYVLPVTTFNSLVSVNDMVTVVNADTGMSVPMGIGDFDILYFGVADCYGNYDLSVAGAQITREFAMLGKGVVFTHDTICEWSSCGNHVYFKSLTDVSGLTAAAPGGWTGFVNTKLVGPAGDQVLLTPFTLPSLFTVLSTHWLGQQVVNGTTWYVGTDGGGTADYGLYMHTYYNSAYDSYGGFFSYGHTEGVPLEWEAKAMINTMYYAFRGGAAIGSYVSQIVDMTETYRFTTVTWNEYLPQNTQLTVQMRAGGSPQGMGDWRTVSNGQNFDRVGRYVQYQVLMNTSNFNYLPEFYDITMSYETVVIPALSLFGVGGLLLLISLVIIYKQQF